LLRLSVNLKNLRQAVKTTEVSCQKREQQESKKPVKDLQRTPF